MYSVSQLVYMYSNLVNYIPSPSPQRLSDLKDSPVILMHIPGPGTEKKAPFKKWNESL